MDTNKRISWADNLKALAIFLVVLGHTGLEGQSEVVSIIKTWIYEFHMPLFFLLSGLSFSIVFNRGNKSVAKQTINMVIIYVLQSVVYILLNIAMHSLLNIQTQVIADFSDLYKFFAFPVAQFWYLHALVIIYLIEWIMNIVIKDDRIKFVISLVISLIGMFTPLGNLSQAMYELIYFELGRQVVNTKKVPIWLTSIGFVGSFIIPFVTISNTYLEKAVTLAIALSVSIFLVSVFSKIFDFNCPGITMIGKNCLWIYIFHTYFTSVSRNICNKIIPTLPVISMIVVTIIGLAGPLIIMFVFKKLKIDRIVTKPVSYFWK